MAPIGNFALLCQGKVYTEDIADNASDLNYWRHIATQDFAAMPAAKENSTHTHTVQRDGAATWKQSHRVRNFNFFWQTISGRFNQFQLKNLIVPAMNAPAEDAVEGAATFLGATAAMRRTTRLTIVCRVCQVERVEASRVGSG